MSRQWISATNQFASGSWNRVDAINIKDYALPDNSDQTAEIAAFFAALGSGYAPGGEGLNIAATARSGRIAGGQFNSGPGVFASPGSGWTLAGDGRTGQLRDVGLEIRYSTNTVRDIALIGNGSTYGVDIRANSASILNTYISDKVTGIRHELHNSPTGAFGSGLVFGGMIRDCDIGIDYKPSRVSNFNVIGTSIQSNRIGAMNHGSGAEMRLTAPILIDNDQHGLVIEGTVAMGAAADSYYLGADITANGGEIPITHAIASITTHSAGARILVTLAAAENTLTMGMSKLKLSGTSLAAYNTNRTTYVYDKPAANQVVLNMDYEGDATGGLITGDNYDVYIRADDRPQQVINHFFTGGNTNRWYIGGGYNINLIGVSGPTKSKWLGTVVGETTYTCGALFQLRTLGLQYGSESTAKVTPTAERVLDIPWSGPGSIGPIMEMGPFRMSGAGGYVPADGAVAVGMRMPYTAGGLSVRMVPNHYNHVLAYNNKVDIKANGMVWSFAGDAMTANGLAVTFDPTELFTNSNIRALGWVTAGTGIAGDASTRIAGAQLRFLRNGASWVIAEDPLGSVQIGAGGPVGAGAVLGLRITSTNVRANTHFFPEVDGTLDCGAAAFQWKDVRALNGVFSEGVHIGGNTFATLPAVPGQGMICQINDCTTTTWGAVAAGGGADKALLWHNGTAWKVIGI